MDLSFLKNEITFGMNRIYLLFDKWDFRPTYYVSVNPLVIEQSAEQICKITSPKFLGLNGLPYIRNHQDTIFLQSIGRPSFSYDPRNGLWEGHTVTYVAMQLAYFMGFSEVILIGVDHYFKSQGPANKEVISDRDDQNHFHPHYFGKGVRWNLPDLAKSEVAYNLAKQTFEADGRRIVDATVDGHLTIFPKADYKQVFSPAPLTINNGELGLNAALIETEFGEYVRDKNENLSITVRPKSDPLVPAEPRREYLVSAIVSTYNSERFLRGCLDDLERQTIANNLEIIVVNSGSQENEEAIVREFQQRYDNIKYIKTEQRETLYTAWNRAIKAARGKFITTANTDDRHRKDAFEALSDALQEYPDVSLVYGDCYVSTKPNENYEENSKCCIYHYPEFLAVDAILFYQFGPQPMWRKNVHETIGYFDESYKAAGDHDFNIRFAMHFKALHIDEPLGLYLEHSEAISFKDNTMRQEQQRIVFDYRKPEIVEKLYRRVGIKADTAEEKAKVFLDMGVRAMEYYPPWKDGRAEHHLDFAFQCFNKAAEFKPDWAAAYNNLAVVLGLSGNLGGAEKLLEKAADMTQDSTISFNLKLISHPLPSIQFSSGAKLLLSGLSLPSQKEASLKRKLSEPLTQTLLSLPQGNVRSNLEYWQQLQDNQYFEKHQYYAGLKAYGTDCEKLGKYTSLSKEMTVVVIGCGYGRETLLIAPRVKHVYGIDVNRTILDKADKFLAERGITNFTSVLAQDWKHVVPSNIDVVYSIVVFQHLTRYLVKDYIHGLAKKLSPNGKFVCQFADLANGTHDAELRPYEPNTRWSQTEIEELIQECGLIQNAIDTQDIPGKGSWYWAFFGKQGARRPAAKILFYFDRIGNLNKISPAGTVIAILNFARALQSSNPDVKIHITGDLVSRPEQYESFEILPLPSADERRKFLAEYDSVFFATHVRSFKGLTKPPGQIWVLWQHCWEADDRVSLSHSSDFDAVICLSEQHRSSLRNKYFGDEKFITIPNLIDTNVYSPKGAIRNNHSIMFAGGLNPHKCVHILLDAFRLVRQQVKDAELHIYGDGKMWRGGDTYGNELKSIKPEGTFFHGYVDNKDMPPVYSKHSILCLPSKLESFGLVTVEAQACGCVPVVHNTGGVDATLADGETGLLYSPNTPEKLAETIIKALKIVDSDPSVRQKAVNFARNTYSINRAAEYISQLWNKINIAKKVNTIRTLLKGNEIEKADLKCKELLQEYPNDPDVLLSQALIMLQHGNKTKANAAIEKLLENFPSHIRALNDCGLTAMKAGDTEKALRYLTKAYKFNPWDKDTVTNYYTMLKTSGRYRDAKILLLNYLTNVGEDARVLQLFREIDNLIANTGSGIKVVSQEVLNNRQDVYCKSSANLPLVSIITPVYNGADYIGQTIESVLAQDYPNFELVIIDDGSTDNTKEVTLRYNDGRIRYLYQENKGVSSARNLAISKAGGQYMMPLDADDMMTPDSITRHLTEFEKHPEADLIYCDVLLIDEMSNPIRIMNKPEYQDRRHLIRDLFRAGHPVLPFRLGIRRSVFDKIGFYDEDLLVGEDYDMMRRFIKAGLKAHHLNEPLHLRRTNAESLTRTYSPHKTKCHFDVVRRFTDTFTYEELFPDVEWNEIPVDTRRLHAKCLAVVTYLAIGQDFSQSNSAHIYAKTAFEQACSELRDCLEIDPNNRQIRALLQKCEIGRQKYQEQVRQAVC
jgi:glycosyltransferase involved in cell wall biosynthesis